MELHTQISVRYDGDLTKVLGRSSAGIADRISKGISGDTPRRLSDVTPMGFPGETFEDI